MTSKTLEERPNTTGEEIQCTEEHLKLTAPDLTELTTAEKTENNQEMKKARKHHTCETSDDVHALKHSIRCNVRAVSRKLQQKQSQIDDLQEESESLRRQIEELQNHLIQKGCACANLTAELCSTAERVNFTSNERQSLEEKIRLLQFLNAEYKRGLERASLIRSLPHAHKMQMSTSVAEEVTKQLKGELHQNSIRFENETLELKKHSGQLIMKLTETNANMQNLQEGLQGIQSKDDAKIATLESQVEDLKQKLNTISDGLNRATTEVTKIDARMKFIEEQLQQTNEELRIEQVIIKDTKKTTVQKQKMPTVEMHMSTENKRCSQEIEDAQNETAIMPDKHLKEMVDKIQHHLEVIERATKHALQEKNFIREKLYYSNSRKKRLQQQLKSTVNTSNTELKKQRQELQTKEKLISNKNREIKKLICDVRKNKCIPYLVSKLKGVKKYNAKLRIKLSDQTHVLQQTYGQLEEALKELSSEKERSCVIMDELQRLKTYFQNNEKRLEQEQIERTNLQLQFEEEKIALERQVKDNEEQLKTSKAKLEVSLKNNTLTLETLNSIFPNPEGVIDQLLPVLQLQLLLSRNKREEHP